MSSLCPLEQRCNCSSGKERALQSGTQQGLQPKVERHSQREEEEEEEVRQRLPWSPD